MDSISLQSSGTKMDTQGCNGDVDMKSRSALGQRARIKIVQTAAIIFSCLILGMYTNVLGPSMLDIEYFTGSTTKGVTTIFMWRHGGYLLSCLAVGPLIDRFDETFLMGVSYCTMAVTLLISPWWPNIMVFYLTFAIGGLANCVAAVSFVTSILSIWASKSDPFQQAAFLSLSIGAMLSPQVLKPFLRPANMSDYSSNDPEFMHIDNTSFEENFLNTTTLINITDNNQQNQYEWSDVRFQYGYLIVGGCVLLCSVFNFIINCSKGCGIRRKRRGQAAKAEGKKCIKGKPKLLILVMYSVMAVFIAGIEETYSGILVTFLVKHLGWSETASVNISTLFWAAFAVSRAVAAFTARFTQPSKSVGVQFSLVFIGCLTFAVGMELHWIIPYISSILFGLGLGATFPNLINWANTCITLRGREMSSIFISVAIGKMVSPPLGGYLFEEYSPRLFIYLELIYSVVLLFTYLINFVLIRYFSRKLDVAQVKGKAELDVLKT